MKQIVTAFFFISSIFGITAQRSDKIQILDIIEFKKQIVGKNVQLVDVRTSGEYNAGFIDNAINIDYFKQELFTESFEKLDKNKPLYIYCRSGNRSQKAARKLIKMGFTEVYDMKDGYLIWK